MICLPTPVGAIFHIRLLRTLLHWAVSMLGLLQSSVSELRVVIGFAVVVI